MERHRHRHTETCKLRGTHTLRDTHRDEAGFQELIQNNQQKNLISYIYSPSIYTSLITDEVRQIGVYSLAIWLFSPMIMDVRTVPNFLLKIRRKCLS